MTEMTDRKLRDTGLLLLRIGFGVMFVLHGWDKLRGGPELWTGLGKAMGAVGVTFAPAFWGFMAAFSEFAGGACIALGIFFRPMAGMLAFTMTIALTMHLTGGDGIAKAFAAIICAIVAWSLVLIGPGNFALGKALWGKKS